MLKYKKVIVEWDDTTFFSGHRDYLEIDKLLPESFLTVGFLISKTKKYLKIALSINQSDNSFADVFLFPVGCLKSIKEIKWN
jgi:hypothetical protein